MECARLYMLPIIRPVHEYSARVRKIQWILVVTVQRENTESGREIWEVIGQYERTIRIQQWQKEIWHSAKRSDVVEKGSKGRILSYVSGLPSVLNVQEGRYGKWQENMEPDNNSLLRTTTIWRRQGNRACGRKIRYRRETSPILGNLQQRTEKYSRCSTCLTLRNKIWQLVGKYEECQKMYKQIT